MVYLIIHGVLICLCQNSFERGSMCSAHHLQEKNYLVFYLHAKTVSRARSIQVPGFVMNSWIQKTNAMNSEIEEPNSFHPGQLTKQ